MRPPRPMLLTRRTVLAALPAACAKGFDAESGAEGGAPPDAASLAAAGPTRAGGLTRFYRALADLDAGKRQAPVVVLQLGDSHTANDAFGSRMREVLQSRFGAAGRGLLPPGIPFQTYAPTSVRVTADAGWRAVRSMDATSPGLFGLSGLRQRAVAPGAAMSLEADAEGGLGRAEVEVLRQPGGGSLEVETDGRRASLIETNGERPEAAFLRLPTKAGSRQVTLRAMGDGPVEVLSWSASRASSGLLYANLGTIGATVRLLNLWDPDIVRLELEHLRPSLLLIAFGTNEGFSPALDPDYGRGYAAAVRQLLASAPAASVLVMGPPDGDWRAQRDGGLAAPCSDAVPGREDWRKPPHLAAIRAAQRRAAEANGWAFWDWSEAMGGDCAMHEWTQLDPPLAQPDHVHLRAAGYRRTADALLSTLLAGYEHARARPGAT